MSDADNVKTLRADMRAKVFSRIKDRFKTKVITFYGAEIEMRQPATRYIMDIAGKPEAGSREYFFHMAIEHAYIPGTDQKFFEPADFDSIMSMPFGGDVVKLQNTMLELTTANIEDEEKN